MPRFLRRFFSRFLALFQRSRWNRDLADELSSTLQLHIDDNLRAGTSPAEARRAAFLALGSPETLKETIRDRRSFPFLENTVRDFAYAFRTLRHSRSFTVIVILTLALGIGANTAIFGLVDAVLLRMLPVDHPEQIYAVNTSSVNIGKFSITQSLTNANVAEFQQHARGIAGVATYSPESSLNVTITQISALTSGQFVSPNYFSLLGVHALLGRTIDTNDDRQAARVAVLGYSYWQQRFAGNPAALGTQILVNNVPFTVIGIAPPEFYGLSSSEPASLLLPSATEPQVDSKHVSSERPKPGDNSGRVIIRIPPGTSTKQVAAQLTTLFRQSLNNDPEFSRDPSERAVYQKLSMELHPAGQDLTLTEKFSKPLTVLMCVVGLVLLIACANIANLLLARAQVRRREIAIRLSLGCSRFRLTRQLFTESLLLAFAGGLAALPIGYWTQRGIIALLYNQDAAPALRSTWNPRVFAFTAALCLMTALLFGIAPALRASRGFDLTATLKGLITSRLNARFSLRKLLVIGQVSLSLALLVGAALFVATFRNLDHVDLGFARNNTLLVNTDPSLAGYDGPRTAELYRTLLERLNHLPGVRSTTLMAHSVLSPSVNLTRITVPGYQPKRGEDPANLWIVTNAVGPRFFHSTEMHLLSGRDFTAADNEHGSHVVILSASAAHHFFGTQNPVGRYLTAAGQSAKPLEIVGVLKNIRYFSVFPDQPDLMFTPFFQQPEPAHQATLLIRTSIDPNRLVNTLRATFRQINPRLPFDHLVTMNQQVESTLIQQRFLAVLSTVFGALALALCAVGIYGVLSYGVAQRTSEIGLRMALGAARSHIVRLVLTETLQMLAIGIAVGLTLAFAGNRLMQSLLFGLTPTDAASLTLAVAILTAVALAAALLPAQRAARIDPIRALRHD